MRNKWVILGALAVAITLLILASALLSSPPTDPAEGQPADIVYPRDLPQGPARARVEKPEKSAKKPPETKIEVPVNLPNLGTDKGTAVQRAVGVPGKGSLVFEIGAITHSPLAAKMLKCRGQRAQARLQELREMTGIDAMEDLEQVGMSDGVMALGGRLDKLTIPPEAGEGQRYGDAGSIYRIENKKEDRPPMYLARVGGGLLLAGGDEDALKRAIDRAEGRAPSEVAEGGYADVRGKLTTDEVQELLAGELDDPQIKAIRELAQGVQLKMNVDEQVAVSMDVEAKGEDNAADLSAALKSAVAVARQLARKDGLKKTAWLLDQARFGEASDKGFALDLAVPGGFILKAMGCDENGERLK